MHLECGRVRCYCHGFVCETCFSLTLHTSSCGWIDPDPNTLIFVYQDLYGAEAFYAYGFPKPWSTNSGIDRHDSIVVYQLVDSIGESFIMGHVDR